VELRTAVAQRQFVVHYQPQVTFEGDVVGLRRWCAGGIRSRAWCRRRCSFRWRKNWD
jgi:hypothetical protein